MLESIEGTQSEEWPPSAPFQQLHVEHRPTGDVILLVGMAGRTHWSAAVEVTLDCKGFHFDVAARLQAAPIQLGSRYRREGEAPAEPQCRFVPELPTAFPATVAWSYVLTARDAI